MGDMADDLIDKEEREQFAYEHMCEHQLEIGLDKWETKDCVVIPIKKMDTNHLWNTANYIKANYHLTKEDAGYDLDEWKISINRIMVIKRNKMIKELINRSASELKYI